jgi:hypothetical protein
MENIARDIFSYLGSAIDPVTPTTRYWRIVETVEQLMPGAREQKTGTAVTEGCDGKCENQPGVEIETCDLLSLVPENIGNKTE